MAKSFKLTNWRLSSVRKNRCGFTLAEVLITLGIIGIVASLTIPNLIVNYQKTQYVTGLKKAYTAFNQALLQAAADKGCGTDLRCTGLFDTGTNNQTFGDEIVKYFLVSKNCGTTQTGCFSNAVKQNYDGSGTSSDWDVDAGVNHYKFITADGFAYKIYNYAVIGSDNCISNQSNNTTNDLVQTCGGVYVDVNGPTKGPNYRGRDIFTFMIANGRGALLYPTGGPDDAAHGWWRTAAGVPQHCYSGEMAGLNCAARIIDESWEMNY